MRSKSRLLQPLSSLSLLLKNLQLLPFEFLSLIYVLINLFSHHILLGLGSIFVHPLHTDNATSTGTRSSIAHILVELDITKK
ncbi:hypothetical protein IEQ34_020572 [Dendrobium chrysotoxum]|uniref:Uncharacterized protein n=1 Tax=Dendrobium chrysotoxum TaxID=161865 RepID=A0AAV7FKK4_DENCH|nr:hypothetical protein IEQ34_020572 [Dendrobium chrysotoxum]